MTDVSRLVRVYIVPGAVFQSGMIGGGYGTGREIVEYFSRFGLLGGALGLVLVTVCFAALLAVSFEFARTYQVYDYRRFFRNLLGGAWVAFEVLFLAMFVLVLAVVAAASGRLVEEHLHLPGAAGMAALLLLVTWVAFYGRVWVTRVLAYKAVILTAVFLAYFIIVIERSGADIVAEFRHREINSGWALGAFKYALYASCVIPSMLFAIRSIETRREALGSGVTTALIGILPAALMHATFGAGYPEVLQQEIPAYWMITGLALPWLTIGYLVILFGSLLDCGLCLIQSVNERLDGWALETRGSTIARPTRAIIALVAVVASGCLSLVGIVGLIAQGYGTMAWGFLVLYVGPILTIGLYKLIRRPQPSTVVASAPVQG